MSETGDETGDWKVPTMEMAVWHEEMSEAELARAARRDLVVAHTPSARMERLLKAAAKQESLGNHRRAVKLFELALREEDWRKGQPGRILQAAEDHQQAAQQAADDFQKAVEDLHRGLKHTLKSPVKDQRLLRISIGD